MEDRREATVSVVIPARNAEATIGATLASLVPDAAIIGEILLVDDSSVDDTVDVARATAVGLGLPLSILAADAGSAGAARNLGLKTVGYPFVFFLDADDRVEPTAIATLQQALADDETVGLAIGAHIRRTDGRPDKRKAPDHYGPDPANNAVDYLRGRMWPIAMGSALLRSKSAAGIWFPEDASLDEDTCFWAHLMARAKVVAVDRIILVYELNEARTGRRYSSNPRKTFVNIARALGRLEAAIDAHDAIQWRKAWVALRIARQLILERRFAEARGMLRAVSAHPEFARSRRLARYRLKIAAGIRRRPVPAAKSVAVGDDEFRTLVLTVDPAWPPVSGADLRNTQNALGALSLGPAVLASVNPATTKAQTPSGLQVVSLTEQQGRFDALIGEAAEPLEQKIGAFQPSAIIVEGIFLYELMAKIHTKAPMIVLDMHNVESHLGAQVDKVAPQRTLKRALGLRQRAIKQCEKLAIRHADRIWVCSDVDASRLYRSHHPAVPIDVVPNAIPRYDSVPDTLPARRPDMEGPSILYFGHLGYRPNMPAARRLAEGILPPVAATLPTARLTLAGRSPHSRVTQLANLPGVSVVADPPDAGALLQEADIVAVPLEAGGGTRLKVLEAMAWGLPVIATPIAVDGLGLDENNDFVPAVTDDEFVREILSLWTDPDRFDALRRQARDTAMRRFGRRAVERAVRAGLGHPAMTQSAMSSSS
ncbi:MAG: glycosyltransferase [Pseudomonadota bacterium]